MSDILVYSAEPHVSAGADALFSWHSSAPLFAHVTSGDRLWIVTSGRNIDGTEKYEVQAGFLMGLWQVRQVIDNPGDNEYYPKHRYKYRIIADPSASIVFDEPILVDDIIRPEGADNARSIGSFIRAPRKLRDEQVRQLKNIAGPAIAQHYLAGRQS